VQFDYAAGAANEGMLEGIGEKLIDDKPCRHRDVDGNGIGVKFQIKPDPVEVLFEPWSSDTRV